MSKFDPKSVVKLTKTYLPPEDEVGLRIYFPKGFDKGTEFRVLSIPKDGSVTVMLEHEVPHKRLILTHIIVQIPTEYFG